MLCYVAIEIGKYQRHRTACIKKSVVAERGGQNTKWVTLIQILNHQTQGEAIFTVHT